MTPTSKLQFVVHNQGAVISSIVGNVTLELKPVIRQHNGDGKSCMIDSLLGSCFVLSSCNYSTNCSISYQCKPCYIFHQCKLSFISLECALVFLKCYMLDSDYPLQSIIIKNSHMVVQDKKCYCKNCYRK